MSKEKTAWLRLRVSEELNANLERMAKELEAADPRSSYTVSSIVRHAVEEAIRKHDSGTVTVDFTPSKLSDEELAEALAIIMRARDTAASQGKVALGELFNEILIALSDEKYRREKEALKAKYSMDYLKHRE